MDADDAMRLATLHARTLGIDVEGGYILRRGHNVLIRLMPGSVVARVASGTVAGGPRNAYAHMRNEVTVARFLAGGAPVASPASVVDAGPHRIDHAVVSYWDYCEPARPLDPRHAGAALAKCHSMLRDAQLEFEGDPSPPLEAQRMFADLVDDGSFDHVRGRRIARASADDLSAMEALALPRQIVHGDSHLENLLVDHGGRHLWNDWEDTFLGPIEWDLACLVATAKVTGAGRERTELALRGYGIERLDYSTDLLVRVRAFQVATWLLATAVSFGSRADQAEPWLAYVERPARRTRAWRDRWSRR